jgi:V/A-type H+-transporting ATPase subunit E
MSLQVILERIQASGEAQVQEVEQEARRRAGEILAQAYIEAERIEADAREEASAPGNAERARILHRARLDALHILGEVREELVDTAIARTRERLASLRSDASYPEVLKTLAEEALKGLAASEGADHPQVQADPRDKHLLENTLAALRLNIPVRYVLNTWGGLIASSADERVVVTNTLEARLERAMPFLRRRLAAYFEEEERLEPEINPPQSR